MATLEELRAAVAARATPAAPVSEFQRLRAAATRAPVDDFDARMTAMLNEEAAAAREATEVGPAERTGLASTIRAVDRGIQNGGSYGFMDNVDGLMMGGLFGGMPRADGGVSVFNYGVPTGERIAAMTNAMREENAQAAEERPAAYIAGNVLGGVGISAVTAPVAGVGRTATGVLGRGAALGAFEGGLAGAGNANGVNVLEGAARGAGMGAAFGVGASLVGGAAQNVMNTMMRNGAIRRVAASAPSMDQLRASAGAIYDQAQNVVLPRAGFGPAAQGIVTDARAFGMDDMLTPQASRVASNIEEAAGIPDPNMAWRELETLRRQAAIPAGDVMNRTQAAIGSRMTEGLDDFVESADPALAGQLSEARSMWGRLRRSEVIEEAIERAKNQASGFENGLRTQFRAILNNPRRLRGFQPEEVAAIQAVVRGTPAGRLMRQVGRLGIGLNGQSNGLGAIVGAGVGGSLGGPMGAALTTGLGTAAKALAERTTRRAAEVAQAVVNAGGAGQVRQLAPAERQMIEAAIRRSAEEGRQAVGRLP